MSAYKMNLSKKLIVGYVKAPPSLKEQAITRLAILLCQDNELKKYIVYESESLRRCKNLITNLQWDNIIKRRSINICKKLPLPLAAKNRLIVRIGSIALQLFSWNRRHAMLNFSPLAADDILSPSDWTLEMRIDEEKIAERLVQDERLPVVQRYVIACMNCLQSFVHSLWNQISPECREGLFHYKESDLVQLWSFQASGRVEEFNQNISLFWYTLFYCGLKAGSRSTMLQCWDEFPANVRHADLVAMSVLSLLLHVSEIESPNSCMYLKRLSSLAPYTDILCFLLTQMSDEQMIAFFKKALEDTTHNVLVYFIRWPYLDLLIPTIKKLWNILSEEIYEHVLITLIIHYSKVTSTINVHRGGYVDYDYGDAMIKLLEDAPDHFKRYVFRNNFHQNTDLVEEGQLLFFMTKKYPLDIQNIRIFQRILQHTTPEEKASFLRSKHGIFFCNRLALQGERKLLNDVLKECLPEEDIAIFSKQILTSEEGKVTRLKMPMKRPLSGI